MAEPEDNTAPVRPTAERLKRGGIVVLDTKRGESDKPWIARNCVYDGYRDSGLLGRREHMAADKFNRLHYLAFGAGIPPQGWEQAIMGGISEMSDTKLAAHQQLDTIAGRLTKPAYAVVRAVCAMRQTWSAWARDYGLSHPLEGRTLLVEALHQLANHWGYPDNTEDERGAY